MFSTITSTIKYVGADNPDIAKFENQYLTPHGMSYNSYIILADKIALLDTVDASCTDIWLSNIAMALNDRKPDFLVVHHMEPDHSANIRMAMSLFPEMKIVLSNKAAKMLSQFFEDFDFEDRIIEVKDGDAIDLGNRTLQVFTAPFVHWPEVIVSYDSQDKVLFSADAFGKFGALQYRDEWINEARRYYCNIVGKYGAQVKGLLKKISSLEIDAIAPLHGPVLKDDLKLYFDAYEHWSSYTPESEGVVVAYSSIYGDTARAALKIAEELRFMDKGDIVTFDLCNCDHSEVVAQLFRLNKAVFAAPTYDASLFPPMYTLLHHLQMKNWQNRRVALVENGTWAPVAGKIMAEMLSKMKNIDILSPTLTIRSTLHKADATAIHKLAEDL